MDTLKEVYQRWMSRLRLEFLPFYIRVPLGTLLRAGVLYFYGPWYYYILRGRFKAVIGWLIIAGSIAGILSIMYPPFWRQFTKLLFYVAVFSEAKQFLYSLYYGLFVKPEELYVQQTDIVDEQGQVVHTYYEPINGIA